jgi:hypothetical protein
LQQETIKDIVGPQAARLKGKENANGKQKRKQKQQLPAAISAKDSLQPSKPAAERARPSSAPAVRRSVPRVKSESEIQEDKEMDLALADVKDDDVQQPVKSAKPARSKAVEPPKKHAVTAAAPSDDDELGVSSGSAFNAVADMMFDELIETVHSLISPLNCTLI